MAYTSKQGKSFLTQESTFITRFSKFQVDPMETRKVQTNNDKHQTA